MDTKKLPQLHPPSFKWVWVQPPEDNNRCKDKNRGCKKSGKTSKEEQVVVGEGGEGEGGTFVQVQVERRARREVPREVDAGLSAS